MNRRKIGIGIGLLLLLVGVWGLWLHKQQMQYVRNRQLIEALTHNDGEQALALVNEGADPNTPYKPTPLPSLAELVKQLFHRSPPTVNDSPTAFLIACGSLYRNGGGHLQSNPILIADVPLIQAMLKHSANVNAKDDQFERTPLMDTVGEGTSPAVVCLLLEYGADVNTKDWNGTTALMDAAMCVHPDMVRLLLDHGADVNAKDKDGDTPLIYADGKPKIVALLRHAGARK